MRGLWVYGRDDLEPELAFGPKAYDPIAQGVSNAVPCAVESRGLRPAGNTKRVSSYWLLSLDIIQYLLTSSRVARIIRIADDHAREGGIGGRNFSSVRYVKPTSEMRGC